MEFDLTSLGTTGAVIVLIIREMWKGYGEFKSNQRAKKLLKVNHNGRIHDHNHEPETTSGNIIMNRLKEHTQLLNELTDPQVCRERGKTLSTLGTDMKVLTEKVNGISVDVGVLKTEVKNLGG